MRPGSAVPNKSVFGLFILGPLDLINFQVISDLHQSAYGRRIIHLHPTKFATFESSACEVSIAQIRLEELTTDEARLSQVCASDVATIKTSLAGMSPSEVASPQVTKCAFAVAPWPNAHKKA